MRTWQSVTLAEELMGVLRAMLSFPQYLITAMFVGAEHVTHSRESIMGAISARRPWKQNKQEGERKVHGHFAEARKLSLPRSKRPFKARVVRKVDDNRRWTTIGRFDLMATVTRAVKLTLNPSSRHI